MAEIYNATNMQCHTYAMPHICNATIVQYLESNYNLRLTLTLALMSIRQ